MQTRFPHKQFLLLLSVLCLLFAVSCNDEEQTGTSVNLLIGSISAIEKVNPENAKKETWLVTRATLSFPYKYHNYKMTKSLVIEFFKKVENYSVISQDKEKWSDVKADFMLSVQKRLKRLEDHCIKSDRISRMYQTEFLTINLDDQSLGLDDEQHSKESLPFNKVILPDTHKRNGIEMIEVKGGTFFMGYPSGSGKEKGVDPINVENFYIGATEVTMAQWYEVMGAYPDHSGFSDCDDCPVYNVSLDELQKFIRKLNSNRGRSGVRESHMTYRLPTEAEWEYAARGGEKSKGFKYSGSNDIQSVAWYSVNSKSSIQSVAQKQPNELGLYDMSGNVWELCKNRYDKYPEGSQTKQEGLSKERILTIRGGSWKSDKTSVRVTNRSQEYPESSGIDVGFRLVLAP